MTKQEMITTVEHLGSLGVLRLSKINGNWYTIHCPFHGQGQERKPSCGILLQDEYRAGQMYKAGMFHCFACGHADSMYNSMKKIKELYPLSEAAKQWIDENILPDGTSRTDNETLIPASMRSAFTDKFAVENLKLKLAPKTYVSEDELSQYRFTVPYMYERRLTDPIIDKYDVGFDANYRTSKAHKNIPCVTFPVRDEQGRTLFIVRRSIEGKFFNYPQEVEKPVYGLYELDPNAKSVVICESCFNALTAVSYGYNAVALLGTGTPYQISQLKRLGVREYILCLDPDEAGHKGEVKLKKALSKSGIVWTMHMPEGTDANDCDKELFDKLYDEKD